MTDFKLDTDALISKAHETGVLCKVLCNPTDDSALQYKRMLNSLDSLATMAGDSALKYEYRLRH